MGSTSLAELMFVLAGAYAIGCLATGYYLVRLVTARDIRLIGSGSSGATNVSRILGWQGFVLTLAIDAAKGGLTVTLARRFGLESWAIWLAILAVVAGHIWPVHLRFKGGKGVAPFIGSLAVVDWHVGLILAALATAAYPIVRQPTLAGLGGICSLPLALWALGFPLSMTMGTLVLAAVILFAHRANLRLGIAQMTLGERPE